MVDLYSINKQVPVVQFRTNERRFQHRSRKEVFQPHLPVRLPCYDLVPITSLTLDGSIHKGLGHRLRVLPTFMT